jgi:tetratricopeptide (TPR) repeat protein
MIHLVDGELAQGEALTRRAIAVKPDFPEALGNLGRIAVARGKPDLAIQIWQKLLRRKPDDAAIRLELGRALVAAKR